MPQRKRKKKNLKNKEILIIGQGDSGDYAAMLAYKKGADVFISEERVNEDVLKKARELKDFTVLDLGRHNTSILKDCDFVIVSPGVPDENVLLQKALEENIKVVKQKKAKIEKEKKDAELQYEEDLKVREELDKKIEEEKEAKKVEEEKSKK